MLKITTEEGVKIVEVPVNIPPIKVQADLYLRQLTERKARSQRDIENIDSQIAELKKAGIE